MNDSPPTELASPSCSSVRITTGARLHLGLFDTVAPFGGVGVMVNDPATEILVSRGAKFAASDEIAARVLPIARRVADRLGWTELPPVSVKSCKRSPAHCGLGSGTQAALAIAEGIAAVLGMPTDWPAIATQLAGRGRRSAVGVHGYLHGGLIFENADAPTPLNPVQRRVELPDSWRVLVVQPRDRVPTVSGEAERAQFAKLAAASPAAKREMLDLLEQEILPGAGQADFGRFAGAVARYNHASGMLFAPVQGGPYNGSAVTGVIETLKRLGASGVGQSSWGPGVFAWFETESQVQAFVSDLPREVQVIAVTGPRHVGRQRKDSA